MSTGWTHPRDPAVAQHGAMELHEMQSEARAVRARYAAWEAERYGRAWTPEEIALGFVGDVGDLAKLVQGKAGVRPRADLDDALAHELADCLWAVLTLAERRPRAEGVRDTSRG